MQLQSMVEELLLSIAPYRLIGNESVISYLLPFVDMINGPVFQWHYHLCYALNGIWLQKWVPKM